MQRGWWGGGGGGEGVSLSGYKVGAKGICIQFNVIVQKFLDFVKCFYMHPTSQVHFLVYKSKHSCDSVGVLVPSEKG